MTTNGTAPKGQLAGAIPRYSVAPPAAVKPSGAGAHVAARDVLQANLAAGDELVVFGPAHVDLPELLRTALVDRDGDHP
jgi:hypothetical protein